MREVYSIRSRIQAAIMLTAVTVIAAAYIVLMVFEWFAGERQLIESITTEADIIASNSTAALAFESPEDAREVLLSASRDPRIRGVALYDVDGQQFASYSLSEGIQLPGVAPTVDLTRTDGRISVVMPVQEGDRRLGSLLVVASLASRSQLFIYYAVLLTGVFGLGVVLAIFLSKVLQRRISSPVIALTKAVERVAEDKDFSVRVVEQGDTEVATLASSFNQMLQEIQERDEALLAREREFRTLVELSPDVIARYDRNGRILYISPAVNNLFGRPQSYYTGRKVEDVVVGEESQRTWREAIDKVVRTGKPQRFEVLGIIDPGNHLTVHAQVVPEFAPDGSVKSVLSMSRDITDRKRTEELLRDAKDRAEAAARAKSAFLANMSHDIRTPLTSIIGFAEILSERVSGENRELTETIHEGGKRLLDTLNSVLDLARLEGSVSELKRSEVNVSDEVRKLSRLFEPRAEAKGLDFRLFLPNRDVTGSIDNAAYGRILMNLVGNAVKFTKSGEVCIEIIRRGNEFDTIVRDSGPGISEDFQAHIFDPFSRESSGTSGDAEGSGLGLAITKQLVELMGGRISVESQPGQGARFTIALPAASGPAGKETVADLNLPSHKKVLLVEDNKNTQRLFKSLLKGRFQLDVASNSGDAVALANSSVYDIVFMDIGLESREAGLHCAQKLRASNAHHAVPIIAFTAYSVGDERERYRQLGFTDLLEKPFEARSLNELLERYLSNPAHNGQ